MLNGIFACFNQLNDYHDKCTVVTDFGERKEIAKKNKLCFKCLLKGHKKNNLGGAAKGIEEDEGIPLTKENYKAAMDLLAERYENKQLITATHIGQLRKLEKAKSGKGIWAVCKAM